LLTRVLYWTGGHPYLTQRLCQAVAADSRILAPAQMDQLCEALFLTPRAREKDDNLLFVRERLLHNEADPASLLTLYEQVRRGTETVADDETNPLVTLLRLAGIVRSAAPPRGGGPGRLRVRNRIYERVFDAAWVKVSMPDAELRRQRAAYRRGLLRATTIAVLILAVVVGLALIALSQAHRATVQRRLAEERERTGRRTLYVSQMKLAQQSWEEGNLGFAEELLNAWRPQIGKEDLRGFEWRYLWRLCRGDASFTLPGQGIRVAVSMALSPDGKLLASGNQTGTVQLWDLATKREIATLSGKRSGAPVIDVAFSPDCRSLAACHDDGAIELWDLARPLAARAVPRPVALFKGHTGWGQSVAFSPDGRILAFGGENRAVRLWEVPKRRSLTDLRGHTNAVVSVAFSQDGKTLASGSLDNTIKLWDVASRRALSTLKGHHDWVQGVTFSPDGTTLATASDDTTVRLWDTADGREIATLAGHKDKVLCVAFSPDGRTLASGGSDNTIKLWDVVTRRERTTLKGHNGAVRRVAFSSDGRTLASASVDGTVKLWDPTMERDAPLLRQKHWIGAITFSPDGKTLAVGGQAMVRGRDVWPVQLWEVATHRRIASLWGHQSFVRVVGFSPDGSLLASSSMDRTVRLWDMATKREIASFRGHVGGGTGAPYPDGVAFSPDGKLLASGSGENTVQLREVASRRLVATLQGDQGQVGSVAFSPDGKHLATGTYMGKLWDVASRQEVRLEGPAIYWPCLFSPDGRMLLTTSGGTTLKLWDLATKRVVTTFKGFRSTIMGLALTPDGKMLAVSQGNTIALWNLAVRQEVAVLKGHTGVVYALSFSPDGAVLASGGGDGTVRLWHAASWQQTDPLRVVARGGDGVILLQWQPLAYATAYRVYRGPAGAPPAQLALLTPRPVTQTTFIDRGPDLVNGRAQTYAVAPLIRGAAGTRVEGPRAICQATPVTAPPGFLGCSMDEGARTGSVVFDAATREILLRGSGQDAWGRFDRFYIVSQPLAGDFQIRVLALTRPTATHPGAEAGLMIRESLEPGSRHAFLFIHRGDDGLRPQLRLTGIGPTENQLEQPVFRGTALTLPILLQLTRRGETILPECSRDGGKSFQPAGDPIRFEEALPETLYAGLAITSQDPGQIAQARFSGLQISKR
jgi:WD40 repeat protein